MGTEWKCPGCGEMSPDEVDVCINCRDDRPGRSPSARAPARPPTFSARSEQSEGPSLDEIIAVLRLAPASSELVKTTCHMLVIQVMCGKVDGDQAGYRLRQIMGELDPGYNALSNAATALGALSAIGKENQR